MPQKGFAAIAWLVVACHLALGCGEPAQPQLESDDEKALYTMGSTLGRQLTVFEMTDREIRIVEMGLRDAASGQPLRADPDTFREHALGLAARRMADSALREKAASAAFLAEASREEGAIATPSGLIYTELEPGSGPSPGPEGTVRVKYRGTLRDGSLFEEDSEARFSLNRVIACWREGLQRMQVGGRSRLVCPSEIGYGDRGKPPRIPGGAALIFEVELLEAEVS